MSIIKAKQNIADIPDDQNKNPIWYNITEYGICDVSELKALADSHSKLLEAAKDLVGAAWQTEDHYAEVSNLEAAIKEAEV